MKPKQRTDLQRKSIHKYFQLLSDYCNEHGITVTMLVRMLGSIDLEMTPAMAKEIWRDIQKRQVKKESTNDLETKEVDLVFDVFNRALSENGIFIPFPSEENQYKKYE